MTVMIFIKFMMYYLFILLYFSVEDQIQNSVNTSQALYLWIQSWFILIMLKKEYF